MSVRYAEIVMLLNVGPFTGKLKVKRRVRLTETVDPRPLARQCHCDAGKTGSDPACASYAVKSAGGASLSDNMAPT